MGEMKPATRRSSGTARGWVRNMTVTTGLAAFIFADVNALVVTVAAVVRCYPLTIFP